MIVRPVTRRLVSSSPKCVGSYNQIVEEQFDRHRIPERLTAVDNLTRITGVPCPDWLKKMITTLYTQMDEIRKHAERNCRKILRPELCFSPPVQHWYDKVHAFKRLIRLREGTGSYIDGSRAVRFAKRKGIKDPKSMTLEQLKDGLQAAQLRKKQLRLSHRGLRNVHNRNCLIQAQEKRDNEAVRAIKAKIERENKTTIWYRIRRVARDPRNRSVLEVEEMVGDQVRKHTTKEEV